MLTSFLYASEPLSLNHLLLNALAKPLVFDVGAHVGNKTAEYLKHGARVVCIEPQPICYQELEKRFRNNKNVVIEKIGLADQVGTFPLTICSSSNTLSTFSKEWQEISRHKKRGYSWDKTIQVTVKTVDMLIQKYGIPQFCKIDVENFEYEVLKGLSYPIPYISFEFHIETLKNAVLCLNHLDSIGYKKFNFAAGEIPKFVFNEWLSKEKLIFSLIEYNETYLKNEKDILWGDIYAHYP